MSFWTKLRDTAESAAVVAGNVFAPGSSLLTNKLVSEGSQEQLGSDLGKLAQLGSSGVGAYNLLNPATAAASGVPMANVPTYTSSTGFEAGGLFNPGSAAGATGAAGAAAGGGVMDYIKSGVNALGGLGTVLNVGGNLLSGYMGQQAAKESAQTQADAQQRALDLQRDIYLSQLGLQQPFREAGVTAQNRLLDLLGLSANKTAPGYGSLSQDFGMQQFQADPGYAFRLAEGQKALERSAAARGGLLSGSALKGAQRFGQDLASQEYQNAFNRYQAERANRLQPLASLTAAGQGAAGALSNVAGQYGQQAGAGITDIGRAQAGGQLGGATALAGGITGALQGYQNQQIADSVNSLVSALRKSQYGIV